VRSRLPFFALSATAAALVLTLSGCSAILNQVIDALQGKSDVFSLTVGDCVNDGDLEVTEVSSVEKPSCDEPHDNEVYLTVELESSKYPADAAYPGDEATYVLADESCAGYFETWVGASVNDTSLYYFPFYPSDASWSQGDREVVCLAYDSEGQVTGSLEGKGPEFPYLEP
jgi:hypothetical protein